MRLGARFSISSCSAMRRSSGDALHGFCTPRFAASTISPIPRCPGGVRPGSSDRLLLGASEATVRELRAAAFSLLPSPEGAGARFLFHACLEKIQR